MSKLVGVYLSAPALFAMQKMVRVQSAGESKYRPNELAATIAGETLEAALLAWFEKTYGLTVGAYLEQRQQRKAHGDAPRSCRVPASRSLPQADGFSDDGPEAA